MKIYYDKKLIETESKLYCYGFNLTDNEVKELNGNYVIYESERFFSGYPIIEGDKLRQATEVELVKLGKRILQDGEFLDKDKIIKVPAPSVWHDWDEKRHEWTVDLEKVRAFKIRMFKNFRQAEIEANIIVHGCEFQVKEKDLENFRDLERAIARGVKKPSDKIYWVLVNDVTKQFTYEQLREVLDARAIRKQKIFEKYAGKIQELKGAATFKDVENVKWDEVKHEIK